MVKISVIVPIYNCENLLQKALSSIQVQSHSDFEVICVDDCSTDNSLKIAKTYAKSDSRFRIIEHERNLGAGAARNTALENSDSEYISFLDSDDYLEPTALQDLYENTDNGLHDVVVAGYRTITVDGTIIADFVPQPRKIVNRQRADSILLETNPSFWNKLWRRSLFVENKIRFPDYYYWEDLPTVLSLVVNARNINFIDRVVYSYLNNPASYTNKYSERHILDYIDTVAKIITYLKEQSLLQAHRDDLVRSIRINLDYHASNSAKRIDDERLRLSYQLRCNVVGLGLIKMVENDTAAVTFNAANQSGWWKSLFAVGQDR